MIIERTKHEISRSGEIKEVGCVIDAEDMRYVASLLRSNYSDPQLAIQRELVANGIDVSDKVDVQLPTNLESNFIVRDYGTGLSEEDMLGLYTKYGKSTKRTSNNYIGGFGIGRFAPLSYTSSFIVTSYFEGKAISYSIYINELGDTVVAKLYEQETSEKNGIAVQVPIEHKDIASFHAKFNWFSFFLKDKINLLNSTSSAEKAWSGWEDSILLKGECFKILGNSSSFRVPNSGRWIVMCGVPYPLNISQLSSDVAKYFPEGMIYFADGGEVSLHHSREMLEYNDKTKNALSLASQKIKKQLTESIQAKVGKAKNLYNATIELCELIGEFRYWFPEISNLKVEYKGKRVYPDIFSHVCSPDRDSMVKAKFTASGNISISKFSRWGFSSEIMPSKNKVYVIDDSPNPRSLSSRMYGIVPKDNGVGVVVTPSSQQELDDFKKLIKDFGSDKFVLLSSLKRRVVKRSKGSGVSALALADVLKLKLDIARYQTFSTYKPYTKNLNNYWSLMTGGIDSKQVYHYVQVSRYKVSPCGNSNIKLFGSDDHPSTLEDVLAHAKAFGVDIDALNIVGVKPSAIKTVKKAKNFIPLEEVLVAEFLKSKKLKTFCKLNRVDGLIYLAGLFIDIDSPLDRSKKALPKAIKSHLKENEDSLKKEFPDSYSVSNHINCDIVKRFLPHYTPERLGIEKMVENFKEFKERYPLIQYFRYSPSGKAFDNAVVKYLDSN
jgi:hypothetical protein